MAGFNILCSDVKDVTKQIEKKHIRKFFVTHQKSSNLQDLV